MKSNIGSSNNSIYFKILFSSSLSIAITIFLLSSILYVNFEKISLSLIQSSIKDTLKQITYSANIMSNSAKTMAFQIYFDKDIRKLYNTSPDMMEKALAIDRMNSYKNAATFVHSIYVYNSRNKVYYTSISSLASSDESVFFDKGISEILSDFQNYKLFSPIPRRIPDPYSPYIDSLSSNVYTCIFYEQPGNSNRLDDAIVINISEEWMLDAIKSMDITSDSITFVIDGSGRVVVGNKKNRMLEDISDQEYIGNILESKDSSGYLVSEVDGVRYLVTYVSLEQSGWKFIRYTPYGNIVTRINRMRQTTLLICIVILLMALVLSFYMSRRLYNPISLITDKLRLLEWEKRENLHGLKQEFLKNIVMNKIRYDLVNIREKFDSYKISLDPEKPFSLLILHIDHFTDFYSSYNTSDRNLFKFRIMNISSEILSSRFNNEPIDIAEDQVLLLFNNLNTDDKGYKEIMAELIARIQDCVQKYADISVCAISSSKRDSIEAISNLFQGIANFSFLRIFYGHRCMINTDEIHLSHQLEYAYPYEKEMDLTKALMLGKTDMVKMLFYEIVMETKDCTYSAFNSTLLHLTAAILTTIDTIIKNSGLTIQNNFNTVISRLSTAETIDELYDVFAAIIEQAILKQEEKKKDRNGDLVSQIYEIINKRYMDKNLCLDRIADLVKMSPQYIGRVFKKQTSESVSEYINKIRIMKANDLLLSTNRSVNDILENTGFSTPASFYSIFKQMHGVSPNEYRKVMDNK